MNGLYVKQSSHLHGINPLIKLIAALPAILFLTLVTDPWVPLVLAVSNMLLIVFIGKVSLLQFIKRSIPMLCIALGITFSYSFLAGSQVTNGSEIWFSVGPIKLYEASFYYGLATGFRLYAMFCVTLIFVMTTEPTDLVRAMIQQWKLNEQFGYGTLAVFRFIPELRRELATVKSAQQVRGMTGRRGKGRFLDRLRGYMVPLLAAAIRRAERTSYAMDARGFGSSVKRTFYRKYVFVASDWFFLGGYWLLTICIVLFLSRFGWMGPLSFLKIFD